MGLEGVVLNPGVYLVTDPQLCGTRGVLETVRSAVDGGIEMVQIRDKNARAVDLSEVVMRTADAVGDRAMVLVSDLTQLNGRRIATSYDGLLRRYLADRDIDASVVRLDGAVESAVRLGVADAVADVVSTGTTLRASGLETFGDPILYSEAVLIGRSESEQPAGLDVLQRRIQGVLVAQQYVMMDYDVHVDLADAACNMTPGLESPTVSPLRDRQWVAVRSMVRRQETNKIMDDLYELGARAILVSSIHACRI